MLILIECISGFTRVSLLEMTLPLPSPPLFLVLRASRKKLQNFHQLGLPLEFNFSYPDIIRVCVLSVFLCFSHIASSFDNLLVTRQF